MRLKKKRADSIVKIVEDLIKSAVGGTSHIKSCEHLVAYSSVIILRAIETIGCTIQLKYCSNYSGYDANRRILYLGNYKIKNLRQKVSTMLVNDYLQTIRNYISAFLLGRFVMFSSHGESYTFQKLNMTSCRETAEIVLFADCLLIPISVFIKMRGDAVEYSHMCNMYPTVVDRWEKRLKAGGVLDNSVYLREIGEM